MSEILKPCPFCGSGGCEYHQEDPTGEINSAYGCNACSIFVDDIDTWNRRTLGPHTTAMLDAARDERRRYPGCQYGNIEGKICDAFIVEIEPATRPDAGEGGEHDD